MFFVYLPLTSLCGLTLFFVYFQVNTGILSLLNVINSGQLLGGAGGRMSLAMRDISTRYHFDFAAEVPESCQVLRGPVGFEELSRLQAHIGCQLEKNYFFTRWPM